MSNKKKYFRNTEMINDIEPGALWKLIEGKFVLEDEDQYQAVSYDENVAVFEETTPPPNNER